MSLFSMDISSGLRTYPQRRVQQNDTPREVTLGDLHGNALKLLHFLLTEGAINLGETDYQAFSQLYEKASQSRTTYYASGYSSTLHAKDLNEFNQILSRIQKSENAIGIRLIGDTLADRGANDLLTLSMFERLDQLQIPFEILYSNHDLEFLDCVEPVLQAQDYEIAGGFKPNIYPAYSLARLEQICRDGLLLLPQLKNLVQKYKKHLKAVGFSITKNNEMTVFTHAPREVYQLKALAEELACDFADNTPAELQASIEKINDVFTKTINGPDSITFLKKITKVDSVYRAQPKPELPEMFGLAWNREIQIAKSDAYYLVNPRDFRVTNVFGHVGFTTPGLLPRSRYANEKPWVSPKITVNQPDSRHINLDETSLGRDDLKDNSEYNKPEYKKYFVYSQEQKTLIATSVPTLDSVEGEYSHKIAEFNDVPSKISTTEERDSKKPLVFQRLHDPAPEIDPSSIPQSENKTSTGLRIFWCAVVGILTAATYPIGIALYTLFGPKLQVDEPSTDSIPTEATQSTPLFDNEQADLNLLSLFRVFQVRYETGIGLTPPISAWIREAKAENSNGRSKNLLSH